LLIPPDHEEPPKLQSREVEPVDTQTNSSQLTLPESTSDWSLSRESSLWTRPSISKTAVDSLIKAAAEGHEGEVRLLLDQGAAVNGVRLNWDVPLAKAAEAGHESIVRLLLDRGAAVDGVGLSRDAPLAKAAKAGHESIVRLLLDR